jgi:anti-sigma factor ChrR (cupin superfamily)
MTSNAVAPGAELNADFSILARAETAAMAWQASPSPSVWRKRLDLAGAAESGRVTSVVRYDAGATFPAHDHPDGEEILVLDGTFSDEHGDYPEGTYLLNPHDFRHAPFSRDGCTLIVKLRQYPGTGRARIKIDTNAMAWEPGPFPDLSQKLLYSHPDHPEVVRLVKAEPGCAVPMHSHPGGEEAFLLEGALEDQNGPCQAGTWLRQPIGSSHAVVSPDGAVAYVKTGGFPGG